MNDNYIVINGVKHVLKHNPDKGCKDCSLIEICDRQGYCDCIFKDYDAYFEIQE